MNHGNVTEKPAFFRTYAGRSHVCTFPGRSAYGSGICHRSYFVGNGTSDQHFIFRHCKENAAGLKDFTAKMPSVFLNTKNTVAIIFAKMQKKTKRKKFANSNM